MIALSYSFILHWKKRWETGKVAIGKGRVWQFNVFPVFASSLLLHQPPLFFPYWREQQPIVWPVWTLSLSTLLVLVSFLFFTPLSIPSVSQDLSSLGLFELAIGFRQVLLYDLQWYLIIRHVFLALVDVAAAGQLACGDRERHPYHFSCGVQVLLWEWNSILYQG